MAINEATPIKRAKFLSVLSECGNVTRAAEEADLNRQFLYRYKSQDEAFSAEWETAADIGAKRLEDEARRRAVEGWQEPVWYQGDQVGTVRKYSDTLLICLLKAHHPEKYADRQKTDTTVSGSVSMDVSVISPEIASAIGFLFPPEESPK